MQGMYGNGERSLRSSTSPFWLLYNNDDDVLQRFTAGVPTIRKSRTTRVLVTEERVQ
jgi:hypothetical protein